MNDFGAMMGFPRKHGMKHFAENLRRRDI